MHKVLQRQDVWDRFVDDLIKNLVSPVVLEKENIQKWLLADGTRLITAKKDDDFYLLSPMRKGEIVSMSTDKFKSHIISRGGALVNFFPLEWSDFIHEYEDGTC